MSQIDILVPQNFHDDLTFVREYSDFPANPQVRQVCVVNGVLYFYTTIMGILTWYPLTKVKASKVHIQSTASNVWTITHEFNTIDFGLFVYDENGLIQMTQTKNVTPNSLEIHFSVPKRGRAVVFFEATTEIPAVVDMRSELDALIAEVQGLVAGDPDSTLTVQWDDIIGKPTVYYQSAIAADQFTPAEVNNLKAGKLANGGSVASVMNRSSVMMFDSATNPDQIFDFQYLDFFIMVYVNRLLLRPTEYIATNGTDITITIPLVDGDEVEFISLSQD
jgi:hypothetical protein